ncbi:MAG: restriction endonuclease subunit S [Prevotellaceae bacterium]|nr:restriction endonuclease subunit S [Prevotellaceae bacterium]
MNGKELRDSLLQWAIRGRLVEQRPQEEPAAALLRRIREEKRRLTAQGKLRRDPKETVIFRGDDGSFYEKSLQTGKTPRCIDDEIPFEIPKSWEWARFGQIMINRDSERIPLSTAVRQRLDKVYDYYGASGVIDKVDRYLFDKDLLLIGEDGANLINRSTPIAFIARGKYWVNNHAHVLDVCGGLKLSYISTYINAISLVEYVTGTAQPKMNQENMNSILVAVPPLAEQGRIVRKLEELLPLAERYGRAQEELDRLNGSLPRRLKASILQEAARGRLVPQRPEEEGSARELLSQIERQRLRLQREGKIRKTAAKPSTILRHPDGSYHETLNGRTTCIDDQIPFPIPPSWQWVRLGNIVRMKIGKTPARGESRFWANGCYNWVSISDMGDYGHISQSKEQVSALGANLIGLISPKDTLLMSFKLTVGRTSILDVPAYHNEAIVSIFPYVDNCFFLRNYLFYLLPLLSSFGETKDAIKGKTLNSKSMYDILVPLPPLAEQNRIVRKIEELFSLID